MSAWYVFSATGLYPLCPGCNEYQLSSPVFNKATLKLDKKYYAGGNFIVVTQLKQNHKVFRSVKLNGKKIFPVLGHEDLQEGGILKFGL